MLGLSTFQKNSSNPRRHIRCSKTAKLISAKVNWSQHNQSSSINICIHKLKKNLRNGLNLYKPCDLRCFSISWKITSTAFKSLMYSLRSENVFCLFWSNFAFSSNDDLYSELWSAHKRNKLLWCSDASVNNKN